MEQLKKFFRSNNIPAEYVLDRTPGTAPQPEGENYYRGHEIKHWLENFPEEVSSYVIIDDDATILKEQQPYLVRVDRASGLANKEDVIKTEKVLAGAVT